MTSTRMYTAMRVASHVDYRLVLRSYLFTCLMGRCVLEVPTETPLSEDQALKYFRDVVAGIEYCEYAGLRCFILFRAARDRKPIPRTNGCSYEYFIYIVPPFVEPTIQSQPDTDWCGAGSVIC